MNLSRYIVVPIVLALALTGCSQPADDAATQVPSPTHSLIGEDGCVTNYDPNVDYFAAQTQFTHASGIQVSYHNSYKTVTVQEPVSGAAAETYVLVLCGATPELPAELKDATQVTIPVHRVATSSATQLPAFELLGVTDDIVAVDSPAFVWSEPVRARIDAGQIVGFGTETGAINVESVVAANPDLFVSSGVADPAHDKLREVGIPVVGNAEWLEETPLGRAEWLKFTAVLTNTEAKANEVFDQIVTDYEAVKAQLQDVETRPTVLTGSPYEGQWSRAGGNSYVARLLADAGMSYVFADVESTGSEQVAVEVVLEEAVDAEIWVNADYMGVWPTVADMGATDPRLLNIKAAQDGKVFNPTKRINEGGGNDYWQQGVVRPDLVLRDLAKAAHPDLFSDVEFFFYTQAA